MKGLIIGTLMLMAVMMAGFEQDNGCYAHESKLDEINFQSWIVSMHGMSSRVGNFDSEHTTIWSAGGKTRR